MASRRSTFTMRMTWSLRRRRCASGAAAVAEREQPLVSIIIRTKNEERWITPCLRAVFNQTHRNVEVIVVDNGSTDRTVRRAKEFPVKVIRIEEFLPGKAINDGVRA